jgi:hypothetical protein
LKGLGIKKKIFVCYIYNERYKRKMPTRLTTPQQKALLNALPTSRKNAVKAHCQSCQMRGEGFMDILKSIGSVLGPIAKEVGPVVLKEFILPFVKKKIAGGGLNPAGGTLKLAGQGKKKKMVKGSAEAKAHMARIRSMRK